MIGEKEAFFMRYFPLGKSELRVSAVGVGCLNLCKMDEHSLDTLMETALSCGVNFFDHADIYGGGESERAFGRYLKRHAGLREKLLIQSKCGIRKEPEGTYYDFSKDYILSSVDGILSRLGIDCLDVLVLHRPDPLMEPEEVAEAFALLRSGGKVRHFGVSNFNTAQLRLLQEALPEPLVTDQLQFSLMHTGMLDHALRANTELPGSEDHDGGVLDYCRLSGITVQAWSPFQHGHFGGPFVGNPDFPDLNRALEEVGAAHGLTATGAAAAWILRHPANIQLMAGTTKAFRLSEICAAADVTLSRPEWGKLYCAAGNAFL